MIICSKCKALIVDDKCPLCSRRSGFITTSDNDIVYLTTVDTVFSNTVSDFLEDNGILSHKKSVKGAGTTVYIGTVSEMTDFYVYASDYDTAKELIDAFNSAVEDELSDEGDKEE